TFSALILLQHLRHGSLPHKGSSGHQLFVSTFMLASKVTCNMCIWSGSSASIQ
ncbi:hypothetical protein J3A83DRAFT_4092774, partial [Scleroderma citrinum]